MGESEIAAFQEATKDMPAGDRIALWAEKFVGTPYDPDPMGEYVTEKSIVADDRVDCMYLVFRAVELALSRTPGEAVEVALDKRFMTKGVIKDNLVANYDERYQYGEDMIDGGKWGREITGELGPVSEIEGSRGRERVSIIRKDRVFNPIDGAVPPSSGDIVFFIKAPEKRVVGEIVGHIGILKREGGEIYLIHASGRKGLQPPESRIPDGKGSMTPGEVKKVLFADYVESMPFIGIRVIRF